MNTPSQSPVITKALHDNCVLLARKCFLLARNTLHGKRQHHKFYNVLHLWSGNGEISGPHSWSNHIRGVESDSIQTLYAVKRYPYAEYVCAPPEGLQPSEGDEFNILLLFAGFYQLHDYLDNKILDRWLPRIEFSCFSFIRTSETEKTVADTLRKHRHTVLATDGVDLNDTQIIFLVTRRQSPPLDT